MFLGVSGLIAISVWEPIGRFEEASLPYFGFTNQNESFIMLEEAKHVFYVRDPCDEKWSVVLHGKTIGVNVEDDDSYIDTYVRPLSTLMSPNIIG